MSQARARVKRRRLVRRLVSETTRARLAALAGAVALSLVAILFARLGDEVQRLFHALCPPRSWLPLLLTPVGFAAIVWATRRWAPAARGSGIPQTMAACRDAAHAGQTPLLSVRTSVAKFAATLAMLGLGGAVGREGPTVQISAAIMVAVQRWLHVPIRRGIVIAGGAAGVAAAFNTPLAGVAFAIEELAAAFEQRMAAMVMATVMVAGLVSLGLAGDYVYFGAMSRSLPLSTMLVAAPLVGVCGGAAGGLFARTMIALATSPHRLFAEMRARPVLLAFGCGAVVAIVGVASGGVSWGTGYDGTRALLEGHAVPVMFGPARFVATLATSLSGAPGGIFAPSLAVGAGLGQALSFVFPGSPVSAIVLLGVIGYFTGVVRAPLTASIIVMEMTADRTMVLPLLATALIADWTSSQISPHKLYHTLAQGFMPAPAQDR